VFERGGMKQIVSQYETRYCENCKCDYIVVKSDVPYPKDIFGGGRCPRCGRRGSTLGERALGKVLKWILGRD
jgi:hypothetical protein